MIDKNIYEVSNLAGLTLRQKVIFVEFILRGVERLEVSQTLKKLGITGNTPRTISTDVKIIRKKLNDVLGGSQCINWM